MRIRGLLIVEMDVPPTDNPEAVFQNKLDDFREMVMPSRDYGITLYRPNATDMRQFQSESGLPDTRVVVEK